MKTTLRKPRVVLLTDMSDVAVVEVALRIGIDLEDTIFPRVVNIKTFDLTNASFLLRLVMDSLRSGDIVVIVCDPRYSDKPRDSVGVKLNNGVLLLGPNNGLMSWVIKDFGCEQVVKLPESEEVKKYPTFNGKYKFAVAANKLLSGVSFDSIGDTTTNSHLYMSKIDEGVVVHIDNYGNIKINLPRLDCSVGDQLLIKIHNSVYPVVFASEFDDVPEGDMLVYGGSSLWGLPEVAINRGSAASYLNAIIGDKVIIINEKNK